MEQRIITLIGGSGFLGRQIVRNLCKSGWRVRVVVRNAEAAAPLKTAGDVGQVSIIAGNIQSPESFTAHLAGSYAVINLVGILFESRRQRFAGVHAQGAEKLAKLAASLNIPRFIHISSLGVDKASGSDYARSKILGERAVRAAFPGATILRPSVIFGPDDNFFNQFGAMAAHPFLPGLPLIGGGRTRFQPVFVGDVAQAVEHCLADAGSMGQTYELGGPHIYSFRELLEMILRTTGRRKLLLALPFSLATVMGFFAERLPRPPLTRDQVRLLKYDNLVSRDAKTFADLSIVPTAVELVVPGYLARFRKQERKA